MENWGISLEGAKMRHEPWPVTTYGKYREPSQNEIDSVYGISGQAVSETILYFEDCGGDSSRLVELLNEHVLNETFAASRSLLLDATRWYTNEYYFYFQMFCKKMMGRYDWHFGENSSVQLSGYHKIWEKGFLQYTPYAGEDKDSTFSMLFAIFHAYSARNVDFSDLYDWADLLCRRMVTISFKHEILHMRNTWLSSEFWYYLIEFIKIVTNENDTFHIVEESFEFYDLASFAFAPRGMLLQILKYMLNKSTRAYNVQIDYPGDNRAFFRLARSPQWDAAKTDKYFRSATVNGDKAIMSAYRLVIMRLFKLDLPPEILQINGVGTGSVSFIIQWNKRILPVPYLQLFAANALMIPGFIWISTFSRLTGLGVFLSILVASNFFIVFHRISQYNRNRFQILKNQLENIMESSRKKVDQTETVTSDLLEEKKMLLEEKEKTVRRLNIMAVYTRKSLVEIIKAGQDPTSFSSKDKQVCVLFADIYQFTRISENKTPMEIVEMLNIYFDLMNQCIIKENGEIDKLVGDGIMAVFSDPDLCVKAAVQMCRELKRMDALPAPFRGKPLRTGIGINYGKVVAGNIGSSSKMDYTVIGDVVNSASRLEALTRHYKTPLIISRDVKEQLKGVYQTQFLDIVHVKGKKDPVSIYEVYDFLDEETIAKKRTIGRELDQAFSYYRRGSFENAISVYEQLKSDMIPANNIDTNAVIPTIEFFIGRCRNLVQKREKGLLKEWDGVYSFTIK